MEVNLHPDTESRIQALASETGRRTDDLVQDAIAGYLRELGETRNLLDSRYDDLKSGRVAAGRGNCFLSTSQKRPRTSLSPMSEFVLHPEAVKDLEELWDYIAAENLEAADRVRDEIYDTIKSLLPFPYIGHAP